MRMWEWIARPLSNRISRCLPTGSTAVTVLPAKRLSRSGCATRTFLPCSPERKVSAVRQMVSPSGTSTLQPQQENRRRGGEEGERLQREYESRRSRSPGQPDDREEGDDGKLAGHQQLPEVRGGAFVRFARGAEEHYVPDDDGERRQRHRHRYERGRPSQG